MNIGIIDLGIRMDLLSQLDILLSAVPTLASGRDHMIRVDLLYEPGRSLYPFGKVTFPLIRERTGLVGYLPRDPYQKLVPMKV